MNLHRMSLQRVRDTAPTLVGAGAQMFDAGLSHPDLIEFMTELAAAPPDAGPDPSSAPESSPSRRHGGRSA